MVFSNRAAKALVRKGGLEPPCLSAPPPQDGVSAISPLPLVGLIIAKVRLFKHFGCMLDEDLDQD